MSLPDVFSDLNKQSTARKRLQDARDNLLRWRPEDGLLVLRDELVKALDASADQHLFRF